MAPACRVCGNARGNVPHVAREMMFGFRDEFAYFACAQCGCLQIRDIPADLGKYYPPDYYAFAQVSVPRPGRLKRRLKRARTRRYLLGRSLLGGAMLKLFDAPDLPDWARAARLDPDAKILDFGSGAGHLLVHLRSEGFTRLTGYDPFLPQDFDYDDGVRVLRDDFTRLGDGYDFIMLHHSFEHVADPVGTLAALGGMTRPGGAVLIRTPVVSSFAWREYGTNWVQLDAPRHLHLHSTRSMELLAELTGFRIESVEHDSSAFQFWGSEQYLRDIPLRDPRSLRNSLVDSIFTRDDVDEYERRAGELNAARDGDQACFLLRKPDAPPVARTLGARAVRR